MKLRFFILLWLLLAAGGVGAQVNYVLNPSFEQYSQCPYDLDQIKFATFWSPTDTIAFDPVCSPEYCNTCCTNLIAGVPTNVRFYQYPRTGNGMAQVVMLFDSSYINAFYRDYLQGRLYKPLTAGKSYCVTFYVNQEEISEYSIANIGAYLDNGSIDNIDSNACALPQTTYTPQIVNTSGVISDDVNWVKIEGTFVANGTEKFITIGNFKDLAHTTYTPFNVAGGSNYSLYLIDDVSVIESNTHANAGNDTVVSVSHETGVVDSAFVGLHELGWDCTWQQIYPAPTTTIGHGAGMWVHPYPGTNVYVVSMTLCGVTTTDTVRVYAWGAGVGAVALKALQVYPNPATNEVHIDNVKQNIVYRLQSIVGTTIIQGALSTGNNSISLQGIPQGLYYLELQTSDGEKRIQKMIKE